MTAAWEDDLLAHLVEFYGVETPSDLIEVTEDWSDEDIDVFMTETFAELGITAEMLQEQEAGEIEAMDLDDFDDDLDEYGDGEADDDDG